MSWQPIESAPKVENQEVLLFTSGAFRSRVLVGEWWGEYWVESREFTAIIPPPSHWMPFPEPPE